MSLNGDWVLRIRQKVLKELPKFPVKDRTKILVTINTLPLNPYAGDVEKMKDEENVWRRRIGAYRIFYEIIPKDRAIYVFRVERRTSKTY